MKSSLALIEELRQRVPAQVIDRSGKVFYSGRDAFMPPAPLYVLGVNPGGDPSEHEKETVASHTAAVLERLPGDWSAYRDESWRSARPGTFGMQPRVLHLFHALGLAPGRVPCSNLVFVRSRREGDMGSELTSLSELCWPFHSFAIERMRPRAVLCFGKTAGQYVCAKLGARTLHAEYIETNNRRWRSQTFVNGAGLRVVIATHPSIADWTAPTTDPTQLVREALNDA